MKYTVAVTQRNFDAAAERYLTQRECALLRVEPLAGEQSDAELDEETLAVALADADAWIVGHARVTRSLLERLPRLQAICRRGVGYERVDTRAVRDLGKIATIAVGGNDGAVADHTVALMLAVTRRLRECQIRLARGDWSIPVGGDLHRKTVGVVGLGRIGRGVVARLAGFECDVLVVSPRPVEGAGRGRRIRNVDLAELLEASDFVTLHAPLTGATRFMIDGTALAKMKPSAVLINTARGGLVDDAALLGALRNDRLAGAGLDVFASESDAIYAGVTEALLRLPNVVATSHSAGSTVESLARTNLLAAQCAAGVLHGDALDPACVVADGTASPGTVS